VRASGRTRLESFGQAQGLRSKNTPRPSRRSRARQCCRASPRASACAPCPSRSAISQSLPGGNGQHAILASGDGTLIRHVPFQDGIMLCPGKPSGQNRVAGVETCADARAATSTLRSSPSTRGRAGIPPASAELHPMRFGLCPSPQVPMTVSVTLALPGLRGQTGDRRGRTMVRRLMQSGRARPDLDEGADPGRHEEDHSF